MSVNFLRHLNSNNKTMTFGFDVETWNHLQLMVFLTSLPPLYLAHYFLFKNSSNLPQNILFA